MILKSFISLIAAHTVTGSSINSRSEAIVQAGFQIDACEMLSTNQIEVVLSNQRVSINLKTYLSLKVEHYMVSEKLSMESV